MITPGIDHIALTAPNLDEQVDRLTSAFGMVVESRFEGFALRNGLNCAPGDLVLIPRVVPAAWHYGPTKEFRDSIARPRGHSI